MTLEQFEFVKHSATTSSAAVSIQSATDASSSEQPTVLPSKRRRFNSEWAEGREWLQHDKENGVMFCEWCRCFDRNEQRMKNDWRNRLRPNTLSQLMLIKLNGPAHLDSFDAQPAISEWWKAGVRSRRPASKPYGPRTKPDSESETDSSESD